MTARTLVWTGFIAIFAFALMAASRFALLDPVENVTLDVTSPVQTALSSTTEPVAEWVNDMTDVSGLSSENDRLRAENERLTNELARAREESAQQQQGQELAEVTSQFPDYQFLDANVIAKDADGKAWAFEGAAPPALLARTPQITGDTFKDGDDLTVIMCPLRDGRAGGAAGLFVTPDGTAYNPSDAGCRANTRIAEWPTWLTKGYKSLADAKAAGEAKAQ